MAQHPDKAQIFDDAMMGIHGRETAAMLPAYNLDGVKVLADVGGGNGSNLSAVLQKYPNMRGILFDSPQVIEGAKANIDTSVSDRCELVGGDFFQSVPPGADAIILKWIIHDWNDEQSVAILKNCHRVLPDGGKLILVEAVVPATSEPHFSKFIDLNMLVMTGGRERTEAEFRKLYEASGFTLTRVVPTESPFSVIEGVKAGDE